MGHDHGSNAVRNDGSTDETNPATDAAASPVSTTGDGGDEEPSFEEMGEEISADQLRIIGVVAAASEDDRVDLVSSADLRRSAGVSSGSIWYHRQRLVEGWGLIEVVDSRQEGGGDDAYVFDLTDRGREFVDRGLAEGAMSVATPSEVVRLQRRVADLEEQMADHEEFRAAAGEALTEAADLQSEVHELRTMVEQLRGSDDP